MDNDDLAQAGNEPQRHKDTKVPGPSVEQNRISKDVVEAALEVHKTLGPGLLEAVYEECLATELTSRGRAFARQVPMPVFYKGSRIDLGYRLDMIIERQVIVEIKAVEKLLPVHEAQLLTYLKLTECKLGLLINFNTSLIKDGIRRLVS
jgi:GxxExxY protein